MARRPPEILVTTPESLNILLTSERGRAMLGGVVTVILDEVHAVAGSKRGVHLIAAVERVARLAGEVQRIALSATVKPAERVAHWVGGFEREAGETYRRRPVTVVEAPSAKRYELSVHYPLAALEASPEPIGPDGVWSAVAAELRAPLRRNRSTLVFANSRRTVEKLARFVNEDQGAEVVYSHHGSLSRQIREVVEERFKAGELKAVVATSSLELGIDVGSVDEVALVQTPPSVTSALQRVGRAGHGVGEVSRGLFVPLVARDLLDAAVVARAVEEGAIEEVTPVTGALDVLAQVIVSMTCGEAWRIDELWAELRRSVPYHDLPRRAFDLVLDMLAGRYSASRIRELRPLVSVDAVDGAVRARPGAERTVYMAGGTIPDRGAFHLRVADSGARLGELDEEFVWERSVGDTFILGVQTWRIESITHNDVFVRPAHARAAMAPFWRAEERNRSFELSERIGALLEEADAALASPGLRRRLTTEYHMDPEAAEALLALLERQRAATGYLPHRHRLVVERVLDPQGRDGGQQVILHTVWGGRVNRPFAMALQAAWERRRGSPVEVLHDDDCVVVIPAGDVRADDLVSLVPSDEVEELLRVRLERSGFFGARFREAAGRALLLPREGFGHRTPLWLSRQRAKQLLDAVSGFEDFPLVLEAWRSCLVDELDLDALRRVLGELESGEIAVSVASTDRPSPFAANATWKRTNELMYEDDTPTVGPSRLRGDLLREVVFAPHLRPRIPNAVIETFERKLQRTFPGYAPATAAELLDWAVERVAIPPTEWRELLTAVRRDHDVEPETLLAELSGKVAAVAREGDAAPRFVAATQVLPRVLRALELGPDNVELSRPDLVRGVVPDAERALATLWERPARVAEEDADALVELVAELLRFFGPVSPEGVAELLGLAEACLREVIEALAEAGRVVVDELSADAATVQVCDAENLERLLRITRAAARPAFEALPADRLPLFLADWQGAASRGTGIDDLRERLERLIGWLAPAETWEGEILPARLDPYVPAWLDALFAESALAWLGCGKERLTFVFPADRELLAEPAPAKENLLPPGGGRFTLEELAARTGTSTAELTRTLWEAAWRGEAANDTFAVVRHGIGTGFAPVQPAPPATRRGTRRPRFGRWQSSRPFAGAWYRLPEVEAPGDPLEAEERDRDRARLLLHRYGVLFRELTEHELPALAWGRLFRALRLLELAGEVLAGQFFEGISGLQFASPEALRRLREGLPEDRVWWIHAADPASPCGLGLEGLPELPRRVGTSHLVFHGTRLRVVSERSGKTLVVHAAPDHPLLGRYLEFLKAMLGRPVRSPRAISVETINGEPAASSPYRDSLAEIFHTAADRSSLRLMRRYGP
jgi:ATP-dependent Lhr-like helicase